MEPMTGIEPAYSAWEADVLPLNYIGGGWLQVHNITIRVVSRWETLLWQEPPSLD